MKIALLFVGFGNVARRFVHLLEETRPALDALGVTPVVVGIATRRHGAVSDGAGLDAARAARVVAEGGTLGPAPAPSMSAWIAQQRAPGAEARVLVETTTLDVRSGEPAIAHVRAAIAGGAHVITANKGPVAFAYRRLAAEARVAGVSFLFEGAVMDGVPVFNLVRETLPVVTIRGFRGVVNSTTNHILTAFEQGEAFAPALARMQAEGIAEADAALDVDGWDAAAKTSALINVLMHGSVTPHAIDRTGIGGITTDHVLAAISRGKRVRLVATAERRDGHPVGRVAPVELDAGDPLAQLTGLQNLLVLRTDVLGDIGIHQIDGGLTATAYALLADLITIARGTAEQ
jgi:homoserine dehydrogenase